MKWWMSAAAQWTLAHVPGGALLFDRARACCGELARLEQSTRFDNALWFLQTARRWCGELGDLRVVELGTGWVPVVPLAFLLSGSRVDTCDVQALVRRPLLRRTLAEIGRRSTAFASAAGITRDALIRRLTTAARARDFRAACRSLRGDYRAPVDTTQLPYADREVDLVVSNLVLQCIPRAVLNAVLAESLRILRPGGIAIHRIRMTDEYAAADPHRSHLAYLQYSERDWQRWFCHALKHQNRLRASHFRTIFRDQGWDCRQVERSIERESFAQLSGFDLAAEFRGLDLADLATVNLDLVVQRPQRRATPVLRHTRHECGTLAFRGSAAVR